MTSGSHDTTLVVLSILIAMAASYTALDLAGRMKAAPTRGNWISWLATASFAMGGGIWSMHFVAMLAFSVPGMQATYDVGLTLVSLALAVLVTGVGFFVVSRFGSSWWSLPLSGLLTGIGIAGMHYTGMAAMRMPAKLTYDGSLVALSIVKANLDPL
jgi:NO-binding membrane sensor protein with MHYT domain